MKLCLRCEMEKYNENHLPDYCISRRDNKSKICLKCGLEESMIDYIIMGTKTLPTPDAPYWAEWRRDAEFQIALGSKCVADYTKVIFKALHETEDFPIDDKTLRKFITELGHHVANDRGGR